jgi:hypothetical protein
MDIRTKTSDSLGLQTKVSVLANGNVGIGTTSPSKKLTVVGGIQGDTLLVNGTKTIGMFNPDTAQSSIPDNGKSNGLWFDSARFRYAIKVALPDGTIGFLPILDVANT